APPSYGRQRLERRPLDRLALPCPDYQRRVAEEWALVGEPAHFVATLPDALVIGPEGAIGASDGTLFYDGFQAIHRIPECGFQPMRPLPAPPDWAPSVSLPEALLDMPATSVRPPTAPRRLPGTSLLLGFMWDYNYYHWMLEALPRLALLGPGVAAAADRLLLFEPRHPFKTRSLERAGLDPAKVEWLGHETVSCERLILPSRLCRTGWVSPLATTWLRRALMGPRRFLQRLPGRGGRRLFVSRQDTANRRMLNEDAVFAACRPHGFERVSLAGLTLDEQIALFAQARAVVAPHGAGMVNAVFMAPGALVVDLMSGSYLNPGIWTLCAACGHSYQPLVGPPARDGGDYEFPPELAAEGAKLALR
ncbi:MAG: glycosyltransferase family 61 protein, partial [Alphaproteobacteria bacterium]|nr:glycosyltransferase family 61 protein [Alphaproteobacteria bacterium]